MFRMPGRDVGAKYPITASMRSYDPAMAFRPGTCQTTSSVSNSRSSLSGSRRRKHPAPGTALSPGSVLAASLIVRCRDRLNVVACPSRDRRPWSEARLEVQMADPGHHQPAGCAATSDQNGHYRVVVL